jgi:phenylpropionate dioxygenase-like ring-hydroxylating dioxygenase large terminal subunit
MTQIVWSDHPAFTVLRPAVRWAARVFLRQDARIMQALAPGAAENPPLLWVGDADQQGRWFVQLKREWLASQREGRPFRNPVKPRTLHWIS